MRCVVPPVIIALAAPVVPPLYKSLNASTRVISLALTAGSQVMIAPALVYHNPFALQKIWNRLLTVLVPAVPK